MILVIIHQNLSQDKIFINLTARKSLNPLQINF